MQGNILVIDDDANVSRLAAVILQTDGHSVRTASDGVEGMEIFSSNPFDVVVTDVKMPRMDGLEVLKAVKAADPSVEVIVFTGYGTLDISVDVIRNGGYDLLRKPDEALQRLRQTVIDALNKRRRHGEDRKRLVALEQANTYLENSLDEMTHEIRRLRTQHAVTRVLTESPSLKTAASRVLTTLLDAINWNFGAIWQIDRQAGVLQCVGVTHTSSPVIERFGAERQKLVLKPGEGLPGEVWEKRSMVTDNTGRSYTSSEDTPIYGIGFPIVVGDAALGALELCDTAYHDPDDDFIYLLGAVSSQIGLFLEQERMAERQYQNLKMEAMGRIAGGIAHDFNNTLTSIIGYAYLIEKRLTPEHPLSRNTDQIQKTGQRAATMVQDILAFARRLALKSRNVALNDIILSFKPHLDRLGQEHKIACQFDLDPHLEPIVADPERIEQALSNLIFNAQDAMPDGGVLRFKTENMTLTDAMARSLELAPGSYIRLMVGDTGHGMDAYVLDHLFDPFFTTRGPGKGTGLGLSTVYGIILQSGGTITVRSAPDEGALFTIYLPVARNGEVETNSTIYSPPAGLTARGGSETILLVEDEDQLREISRQTLQEAGYNVLEASNGVDALGLYEKNRRNIQLLVTDIVMPMMNGDELARRLIHTAPDVRILFITGYADDRLIMSKVSSTGIPLLEKPFTQNDLLLLIREELDAPQPAHHCHRKNAVS